jgi:hypothetical protein
MHAVQSAHSHAPRYSAPAEAERRKLSNGYDAVLPARQPRELRITWAT